MNLIINPKYLSLKPFIEALPRDFENSGEMVYEARNQLKKYQVNGFDIIVKRYKKPNYINRFAYAYVRPSKAKRAYKYALKLRSLGVDSPEPIAYLEERENGLLGYAYFVSIFETQFVEIREIMEGFAENDTLLSDLALYIADFHSKGVLHLDMSPGNILYKKVGDRYFFTLIDINRMQFLPVIPNEKRYKSFKRLTEFERILTPMAKVYAKAAGLNEAESVREINKYSHGFFNSPKFKRRLE
jgi:RIO-like serine/threonine protein kinase fused to N-terminal HTH domain